MEITGTYSFAAAPERVWSLLQDPEVIATCIPGCDRFEPDGDDRYRVRLTVALAAITGTYDGTVSISEKIPPTSYRLIAEGQGRPGALTGSASIALRADSAGTIVEVSATVQTRGTIARMGQRLIGGVSQMMMDRFFSCLQSKL
jgi:carbon monoxide dehydrogenase subunit G